MSQWWHILTRKKELDPQQVSDTQLGRVLNTFDLTFLGVGSTLGVGVYVLAGHVARDTAGPSVIISFLIAAITSVFAGLCYAEFGARVPRAGSAYIYSYVAVGELIAFIIGWNLILEYMIGAASVSRAFTQYLDNLLGYKLNATFAEVGPIDVEFMSPYFDFLSFGITVLLGIAMAFGLKESKWVNNIFTILNLAVVIFVIAAGIYYADINNWKLQNIPPSAGDGGFTPYGVEGIFAGAATCFYGFVGFDCIATTGEEVKNPKKAIPLSIMLSLFIIFLAYFGTSAAVTLMWPYYDLDPNSPIPYAFEKNDFSIGKWIVAIGGMFGLIASLFGAMFPLPRIIYAMAEDSLIFKFLGKVNKRFKTPVIGTLIAAFLTGLISALFDLKQLVNMMSIGTLMAYTIVAACVLLLRYSLDEEDIADMKYALLQNDSDSSDYEYNDPQTLPAGDTEDTNLLSSKKKTAKAVMKQMFNFRKKTPNHLTRKIINVQVVFFCVLALTFAACMKWLIKEVVNLEIWALATILAVLFFMLLTLFSISAQPSSPTELNFKVPFVPLLPAISICVNIYLMLMLDYATWIRFGVWMAIGRTFQPSYESRRFSIQNGIVNFTYIAEETVQEHVLTVPEIVVQPATPSDPETKLSLRKKFFERPTTEFYENSTISPRHSPEEPRRKVSLVFDRQQNLEMPIDTDTESESSEEHHIQAEVHREHDDEYLDPPYTLLNQIDPQYINTHLQNLQSSHPQEMPQDIETQLRAFDPKTLKDFLDSDSSQEEAINYLNLVIKEAENQGSSGRHHRQKNPSTMSLYSFKIEDLDELEGAIEEVIEVRSPRISAGSVGVESPFECGGSGKDCVVIELETGEVKSIPKEEHNPNEQVCFEKRSSKESEEGEVGDNAEPCETPRNVESGNSGVEESPGGLVGGEDICVAREGGTMEGSGEGGSMVEDERALEKPGPSFDPSRTPEGTKETGVEGSTNNSVEQVSKDHRNSEVPKDEAPEKVEVTVETSSGMLQADPGDASSSDIPKPVPQTPDGVPAPPPISNFLLFSTPITPTETKPRELPRPSSIVPIPQITSAQLQSITLKKTPITPKPKLDIDPDFNETVKPGTKEMESIIQKLNNIYRDCPVPYSPSYKPQNDPKPPTNPEPPLEPPPAPEIITTTDTYAKTKDFKDKLGTLLMKKSSKVRPRVGQNSLDHSDEEKIEEEPKETVGEKMEDSKETPKEQLVESIEQEKGTTVEKALEDHRKKMTGTLRSIKLRRTGLIDFEAAQKEHEERMLERQSTGNDVQDDANDDKSKHKNKLVESIQQEEGTTVEKALEDHRKKMTGTLRSIKLKRTGLIDFEAAQKEHDERMLERQSTGNQIQDDANDDKSKHKTKMIATLRSIKLRKTGILDINEKGEVTNFDRVER